MINTKGKNLSVLSIIYWFFAVVSIILLNPQSGYAIELIDLEYLSSRQGAGLAKKSGWIAGDYEVSEVIGNLSKLTPSPDDFLILPIE